MEKNSSLRLWTPILIGIALAIGLFFGRRMNAPSFLLDGKLVGSTNSKQQKMQDILNIIDQYYVDSVDKNELFEQTIANMLHKLDPHSNYIPADELKRINEQIQGEFSGVGIRFFIIRDTICVVNVIPNSPSEAAGVKSGDKIIQVDDKNVTGDSISNEKVMKILKGKTNTRVKVEIFRNDKKLEKTIIRGKIPIKSVSAFYMLNDETGFLKIDQFSLTTADEFRNATHQLKQQGMKKLILDLRNNAGGVMQSAVEIVDEFLTSGKIIVSTKGAHSKEMIYRSTRQGALKQTKLVVLINENSASASEIVAGALQDNDRATIVGRRSFGKGLVQEDIQLRDQSNLRLTIARYYTPTGRSIQKPFNGNIEDYYHEQNERYKNGELFKIDSSLMVDSLKYTTPGGKTVYGGGGIMPDVFVPLDTIGYSWYLTQLRYLSAFQIYAFDFANGKYDKWESPQVYNQTFTVGNQLLNDFVSFCAEELKIPVNQSGLKISRELIKEFLKAEIARQIWTEKGFYVVINQLDDEIKTALGNFEK